MTWVICAVAAVGLVIAWRCRRRKKRTRIVSLVALLREPVQFDPLVLAKTAGKVFNADLGDGTGTGTDGFVAGAGPFLTIAHGSQWYLVNCLPKPYVENTEAAAAGIGDLRIRELFREHRAWFSCDAMGVDGRTTATEITDAYRRLAKLFAEFLDDNCLLIFVPETGRAYSINDDTENALQSDDPLAALQATLTVPIVAVSGDDPQMQQAVARARNEWQTFLAAFEENAGENFAVKAPVSHSGNTEFIWLNVTAVEGDHIYGTLGNEPVALGPLKLGSKVQVSLSELNDWCYVDPSGKLQGGFTIAAVQSASRKPQKK